MYTKLLLESGLSEVDVRNSEYENLFSDACLSILYISLRASGAIYKALLKGSTYTVNGVVLRIT
jgi:hypothetical protein